MGKHVHRFYPAHRGFRRCRGCMYVETSHAAGAAGNWAPVMTLKQFADNWLPMISGIDPKKMMTVDVAAPFEWNCYESWNIVYRVRFDFTEVLGRRQEGLGTPADIMNGWRSEWHETFNAIDREARTYFLERTGRKYLIGDNTYGEMRAIIQS